MGKRSRARKGVREHISGSDRDGRGEHPECFNENRGGGTVESKKGGGDAGEVSRKTHSIRKLDDGTICIGEGCSILRIPPTGDIQIDATQCPDDVSDIISERLNQGSGADFKMKPRKKK